MEKLILYYKPTCTTCRQVHKALKDSGLPFEAVEYYKTPFTAAKLKQLLNKMGISAEELLRKKEEYQDLGLAKKKLDEKQLLDLMVKHPDLIPGPIVEKGNKALLARPADKLKEILK